MFSSSFFDAEMVGGVYDRTYAAAHFAEYFASFIANGVFPDPATNLQVVSNTTPNMTIQISDGLGWINGYYCKNTGPHSLAISAASGMLGRLDAVVLRWDKAARNIMPYLKVGTPSSSPVVPDLERTPDIYELMLATVLVGAGVTKVVQANITDKRPDESVCGYVHGALNQIDATNLFAQYDDAFKTWFDDVQSQLSGDIAANLQRQITNLQNDKLNISSKASTDEANAGVDDTKYMTPLKVTNTISSKIATTAEAIAGTDDTKLMTPLKTKELVSPLLGPILDVPSGGYRKSFTGTPVRISVSMTGVVPDASAYGMSNSPPVNSPDYSYWVQDVSVGSNYMYYCWRRSRHTGQITRIANINTNQASNPECILLPGNNYYPNDLILYSTRGIAYYYYYSARLNTAKQVSAMFSGDTMDYDKIINTKDFIAGIKSTGVVVATKELVYSRNIQLSTGDPELVGQYNNKLFLTQRTSGYTNEVLTIVDLATGGIRDIALNLTHKPGVNQAIQPQMATVNGSEWGDYAYMTFNDGVNGYLIKVNLATEEVVSKNILVLAGLPGEPKPHNIKYLCNVGGRSYWLLVSELSTPKYFGWIITMLDSSFQYDKTTYFSFLIPGGGDWMIASSRMNIRAIFLTKENEVASVTGVAKMWFSPFYMRVGFYTCLGINSTQSSQTTEISVYSGNPIDATVAMPPDQKFPFLIDGIGFETLTR